MRISWLVVIAVLAVGCKSKKSEPAKTPPPAGSSAAPPAAGPGSAAAATAPCCCVTDDAKDGLLAYDGEKECSTKKGKCVTPMTKDCESELAMEKAAEDRNNADDACPSKDRKDCDGDGFRYSDDKDDMDPKVH